MSSRDSAGLWQAIQVEPEPPCLKDVRQRIRRGVPIYFDGQYLVPLFLPSMSDNNCIYSMDLYNRCHAEWLLWLKIRPSVPPVVVCLSKTMQS